MEDLKAFVLTVVDEETAETTTWRSPSVGKWVFDSKPLLVTWQMKSKNISFEGEKSIALGDQIKAYIESKLVNGNVELTSDTEQRCCNCSCSSNITRAEFEGVKLDMTILESRFLDASSFDEVKFEIKTLKENKTNWRLLLTVKTT